MKYHALFVIFEKSGKICNCHLLQIIDGALRVKGALMELPYLSDDQSVIFDLSRLCYKLL